MQATEIVSVLADMWRKADDDEKRLWEQEAVKDRERYQTEMAAYTGPTTIEVPPKRSVLNQSSSTSCVPVQNSV